MSEAPRHERGQTLERLRERFTAVNTRSRTIRLNRCTRSGAFDLARLPRAGLAAELEALLERLGRSPDARVPLADQPGGTPERRALADDLAVLARRAHSDWLETGLRDLAVGWPLLEGRAADGTWLRSPVLLYPMWLETTTKGRARWEVRFQGPPVLNVSLAQTLRRLTGIKLTLDELLADDDDQVFAVDDPTWRGIGTCLTRLGLRLEPTPPLPPLRAFSPRTDAERDATEAGSVRLEHHLVLGRFPPSGSSIVGDYDELLEQPVSDAALGRAADLLGADEPVPTTTLEASEPSEASEATESSESTEAREATDAPLEGAEPEDERERGPAPGRPTSLAALASDSSQDELLRWLDSDAPGIVVQGPPGTGKSQLIANLLTAVIERGQRALVVCEKRAALDVVAERLTHVGLGEPLALVHDVAADRNAVCRSIAATLDAIDRAAAEPDEPPAPAPATQRVRTRLALTQEAFTTLTARPDGRPPLARLQELALDDPGHPLPDLREVAEGPTPEEAEGTLPRLESLARETEALAAPHPLAVRGDWSGLDDDGLGALRERVDAVRASLGRLAAVQGGVLTARESAALRQEVWSPADVVLGLLAAPDGRELARFSLFWTWTGGHATHGQWRQIMQVLEQALRQLHPVPYELVLEPRARLEEWIEQLGALARIAQGPGWRRILQPRFWRLRALPAEILDRCPSLVAERSSVDGSERALPVNVERLCREAIRWQELVASLPQDDPFLAFGFQGDPTEVADAIEELRVHHDSVRALHVLQQRLGARGAAYAELPRFEALGSLSAEPFVVAALADRERARLAEELRERVDALHRACAPRRSPAHASDLGRAVEAMVDQALDGAEGEALRRIDELRRAWSDAPEAARLDALLRAEPAWVRRFLRGWRRHASGAPPGDDARWALRRAWQALALEGRPRTVLEAALVDDELLRALADDVAQGRTEVATRVAAVHRARLAARRRDRSAAKALRQLGAQARKRRRRLTLRQLVEQFWDRGLADARPVWLCSPDSVAAMFPLRRDCFDLLIIDEASQCPVESAVPVALRARRVLVAGDEQQMPPSRFFQASHGVEDEDGAVLGSQSVLELARVAYPSTTLRWHYRSRHEALVAYSNRAFYGGRLITAARAERALAPQVEGLHFVRVEGRWQGQRNRIEAERVVDLVGDLLGRSVPGSTEPPSIGVITFNLAQAELIQERLETRARSEPALRRALARDRRRPAIEQLFVRNLENVQGDERDVIVFSPGYGPSEAGGPVHARFGPLSAVGGGKRLNVAITRARIGVWVVCSFDPDALDVSGTRHVGPRLLRGYLRYVRAAAEEREPDVAALLDEAGRLGAPGRGAALPTMATSRGPTLGARVRDELAAALRTRGLEVSIDHGLGARRIDLAVRASSTAPWALGIECTAMLSTTDPLTRDVYTQAFWRRLGWTTLRITPGMWLEEREAVLERITAQMGD